MTVDGDAPAREAEEAAMDDRTRRGAAMGARPRGVLLLLAVMLAASGAARLGFGSALEPARSAMAQGLASVAPDEPEAEPAAEPAPQPQAAEVSAEDASGIEALIETLAWREADLEERETAFAERMAEEERRLATERAEMAQARSEMQAILGELEAAEAELDAAIARASGAAEEDLSQLTTVYERMKPRDAAKLFETMQPEFAAGFLGRMNPEAAAAVMAGMSPERGYAVSAVLAGRNVDLAGPADLEVSR